MIFILGYKGFVGSAIHSFYLQRGIEVAGIDIDNYDSYIGKECSIFINANGNSNKRLGDQDPHRDFQSNVGSVMNTFRDFTFRQYVHISTIDVYNDLSNPDLNRESSPIDPSRLSNYGFNKWIAERLVEKYAPRHVILRLGGMFGPNCRKGPAFDILNGQPIWCSPESRFIFLHTSIVAEAVFALAGHWGEIFNVTAGGNLSLTRFSEITGKKIVESRGTDRHTYCVNNEKACRITALPTSEQSVIDAAGQGTLS